MISEKVKKVVCEVTGVSLVHEGDSFQDDLSMESLDSIELCIHIESEFDIEISDEDIEELCTVQSLIDYVEEKIDV